MISRIEAHSFKSMPPAHEESYDGWHLRLSNGRTKRINSVNFLKKVKETVSLPKKISFCEHYYNKHQHPCRFRITSLSFPASLENALSNRGYQPIDKTDVLIQDLGNRPENRPTMPVTFDKPPSEEWLRVLCRLTGREGDAEKQSLKDTLARIEIDVCYASIRMDGEIVACGLATFDDGIMGLFEIATDPKHQRKGLGRNLINHLMAQATTQGIKTAYLQVIQSNLVARSFWASMGFSDCLYDYQYWVQPVQE